MATIIITDATSGSVDVNDGDVVIIDPSAYGTYTLYAPPGAEYDVLINQDLPNSITFFTSLDSTVNARFAPGVSAYNLDWGGVSGYGGVEIVETGDGFRITDGGGYSMGEQDDTLILGQNNYVDNAIWMGDGQDTLIIGDNSTVFGQINTEAGNGDVINIGSGSYVENINLGATVDLTIGSNVTVNGYIYTGFDDTIGDKVTIGDNATLNYYVDLQTGNDTLAIGDGATMFGRVYADEGDDLITIGDDAKINEWIWLYTGNDTLTIGDNAVITDGYYGELYADAGDDLIVIGDNASMGDYAWVEMGTGNDTLSMGVYDFTSYGQFWGEGGTDTLNISEGFGFTKAQIEGILAAEGWRDDDGDGVYEVRGNDFRIGDSYFYSWERVSVIVPQDGIVDGTAGADNIAPGYTDAQGDQVDGTDGLNDVIRAGAGNDVVNAGAGDDTVDGGSGNDAVSGGDGNDLIRGDGVDPLTQVQRPLLTLTNTDNLQDAGQTEASGSRAVELVKLADGRLIMVTSENGTGSDGIATYEIDGDPNSATFGRIINPAGSTSTSPGAGSSGDLTGKISQLQASAAGAGFDNIQSMEAVTLPTGETYVFTADVSTATIGIARVGANGGLTEGPSLTDATRLDQVQGLSVINVGGQPILLAYSGGNSDSLLSYSINPATGGLTLLDREVDGNGLGENFLAGSSGESTSFIEGFTNSAGQSFVLVAGNEGGQNGISLWTVNSAGQFTFQNARGDDQNGGSETDPQGNTLGRDLVSPAGSQTGLDDSNAATWAEIGGRTYVFVGGNDDDVTIFRVDPDARGDGTFDLTLVGHADNVMSDISALHFIPSGDSGTLVIGGEQSELRCVAVHLNPTTGVVTLDLAGGRIVDDAGEPGAELLDSEDLAYLDGVLVSASDNDNGVAVLTVKPSFETASGTVDSVAGDDVLNGGAGNDTVEGGEGNDTLNGGAGSDTLRGEGGDDTFLLQPGFGTDAITGGETGEVTGDVIDATGLTEGVTVTMTGPEAGTISGASGTATFSEIESVLLGSGNDTVNGGAGNDTVDGGAGNDVLNGGGGNDSLAGGTGDDAIDGGTGNDALDGGIGNDALTGGDGSDTLAGGEGADTLDGGIGNDALDGGAGADQLSGGEGTDTLAGGDGNDTLNGGAGSDTLRGEGGDDTFVLTPGFGTDAITGGETGEVTGDVIDATGLTEGVAVTMTGPEAGTISGPSGTATFSEIESVKLGSGNDTVNGGAGNDTVDGGAGNDVLNGGGGNDSLAGGTGDDVIDGGTGNDALDGGIGNDALTGGDGSDTLAGGEGADTLDGGAGNDALDGGAGNDGLSGGAGNDALTGGEGSDTLVGGAGNDTLDGGAGDDDFLLAAGDVATGGTGDDEFRFDRSIAGGGTITVTGGEGGEEAVIDPTNNPGGRIGDVLDLTNLPGAVVTLNPADPKSGTVTYTNDAGETVTIQFSQIETVLLPQDGVVDGTAAGDAMGPGYTDAQGDQIDDAASPNDVIDAGGGNDTVDAGQGDDTVTGGAGDDGITGNAGDDRVEGGSGNDTLSGDTGNDFLTGNIGNDVLDGGADNDTLFGGQDNDRLTGGTGDDSLQGNPGDDTLSGGEGNDTLSGGENNDTLNGEGGNDSLLGGDGRDLADGGEGDDVINTRSTQATPDVAGGASDSDPNDDRDTIFGGGGNDTILAGDDADSIFGGDGNDSIDGGVDNDTIDGGADDDVILGDEGRDSILGGLGNDLLFGGVAGPTGEIVNAGGVDPLPSNNADTLDGGAGDDTIFGYDDNDSLVGGDGSDVLDGGIDDDTLSGGADNDTLSGGQGRDSLIGGEGADVLIGGADADRFVVSGADTLTDFNTTEGIQGTPGASNLDNDFVDLSGFYNDTTLAAWNAVAGNPKYDNPLEWMKADQADGVLQSAGGLRIQNGGVAVAADQFSIENTGIICFVRGTRVTTADGERGIEELVAGDLVKTRDHGYQPIRWIGSTVVPATGRLAPIVFEAGAIGNARRLKVSPQHRMLLGGWQAELLFDEPEVLVAAKMMVNDTTIRPEEGGEVEYFHMLFDAHEIVYAEGAASESFHPGHQGWGALAEEAREEILTLFPMLEGQRFEAYGPSARRSLTAAEARVVMELIRTDTGSVEAAE